MFRKNKLAMLVGEFLGTGILTLVVLGALRSQAGGFFVAVAAGLLLVVMTLALSGISGAVFNPAISIALWTIRKLKASQMILYVVVQVGGAVAAWYLFKYITKFDSSLMERGDVGDFLLRPMLAELIGTFIFGFGIAAAIYQRFSISVRALTIGASLTVGAWVASLGAGAFLNPALAFGMQQWNIWVYIAGPILGAVLAMNLYNLLFVETELAEEAEPKANKNSNAEKLDSSLSPSIAAADYDAKKAVVEAKTKVSGASVRRDSVKKTATKSTTKKVATNKKTTTKKK